MTNNNAWFVHKHEVRMVYGGPEEGGWWFTAGTPCADWTVEAYPSDELASARCRELNDQERARADRDEQYGFTSVLSHRSTHYSYSVEHTPAAEPYPAARPYYC